MGVLYGRYDLLDQLIAYKVRPASEVNTNVPLRVPIKILTMLMLFLPTLTISIRYLPKIYAMLSPMPATSDRLPPFIL